MIHVIASISVKDGQLPAFIDIFKANVPAVLAEEGCIEYVPTIDVPTDFPPQELNSSVVTIIEKWRSVDDLRVHLSSPHMCAYQEKVKGIVDTVSIKVLTKA